MSNAVFPVLPGQTWPRVRVFQMPAVIKRANGRRYALGQQLYPTYLYRLNYAFLREADYATLGGFWLARGGPLDTWLFNDRDDNTTTSQLFVVGDGSKSAFQLVRSIAGYAEPVYDLQAHPTILGDGGGGINLLQNSSFEADSDADGMGDGWSVSGSGGTISGLVYWRSIGSPSHGAYEQGIEASSMGADGYAHFVQSLPLHLELGGLQLRVNASIRGAGCRARVQLNFLNSGGLVGTTSPIVVERAAIQGSPAIRYGSTVTVPIGTTRIDIYCAMEDGDGAACAVRFDALDLKFGDSSSTYSGQPWYRVAPTGLVNFYGNTGEPYAYPNGVALTWSGQYYWRCAFTRGEQDFEEFLRRLRTAKTLEFETVR